MTFQPRFSYTASRLQVRDAWDRLPSCLFGPDLLH